MAEKSYMLTGKWYAKKQGAAEAVRFLGNTTRAIVSFTEQEIVLKDATVPGGGNWNEVRRIDSQEVQLDLREISKENLGMVFRSVVTAIAGSTAANEAHTAYKGGLLRTVHPAPTSVTVTGSGGTPTYVAGTDYEVRSGGVYILEASTIANGTPVEIDYTYAAYDRIQPGTVAAQTYELFFDGVNEAQNGAAFWADIWKMRLSLPENFDFINLDDFGTLAIKGKMLADPSKGVGESQYWRIRTPS